MLTRNDLSDYQIDAINFFHKRKKCALFVQMGLGKTVTALTAVADCLKSNSVSKILIIAPLRVVKHTWKQEANKWTHLGELKFSSCIGSEKDRIESLQSPHNVLLINKENVLWLVDHLLDKFDYDMLIIDESSTFKAHNTKRFKAIRRVLKHFKRTILLSGTPSPNGYMDLWSQIFILDNGNRLGKSITKFRTEFFHNSYSRFVYHLNDGAEEKINELIKDICLTIKASDHIKLPDKIITTEFIDFSPSLNKEYIKFAKDMYLSLGDQEIIAQNSLILSNKLLQFCNGNVYITSENGEKEVVHVHNEKIKALKEIVEDNPNTNFLIAYNFKSDLHMLKESFKDIKSLEDDNVLDQWNEGKVKLLALHPASAGHGLNLQHGGYNIIWFGLNFSLELYLQFNARLHRRGQKSDVIVTHLIMKNTIEEKVMESLENKDFSQEKLLEFLKDELIR